MQYFFLIIAFLFISPEIKSEEDKNSCTLISNILIKSEEEIIQTIEDNMHRLKANSASCIDILVKSGKFKALDFYLSELSKRDIKFKESLEMSINTLKKSLDDIRNKYRFSEIEYQSVEPAFQWAQSLKNIFLEVKFAHRHDAPGCLEIKDLKVDIKENNVGLIGYCVLGDVPIKIDFHVNLYKGLNVTNCTHEPGSVGRYKITLEKKEESYWRYLLKEGTPQPKNMRVWFEMRDKYLEELKKYIEEDDNKAFEEELLSMKGKKKKNKKHKHKDSEGKVENKTEKVEEKGEKGENKTNDKVDNKPSDNKNKTEEKPKDKKKDL